MKWEKPDIVDFTSSSKAFGAGFCFPGATANANKDCDNGYTIYGGECAGGGNANACVGPGALPSSSQWVCSGGALVTTG